MQKLQLQLRNFAAQKQRTPTIKFGRKGKGGPPSGGKPNAAAAAAPPQKGAKAAAAAPGRTGNVINDYELSPRYGRILPTPLEIDMVNSGGAEGTSTKK